MSTSWDQEMDQEIGITNMEFDHGAKELSDMPPAQFYLWKEDTCIPPALEQNSNDKRHGATNMEYVRSWCEVALGHASCLRIKFE